MPKLRRIFKNAQQNQPVFDIKSLISPCHHPLDHLESLVGFICLKTTGAAPGKGRHKISRKAATKNIGANANHRAGIEHGVDAAFGVVAHEQAAELLSRALKTFFCVIPKLYLIVIIFQIGIIAIRADIAPFAEHRIAQEAVVPLVGVADENGVIDLAAQLAVGPQGCRAVYFCAEFQDRMLAHRQPTAHDAAFHDLRVFAHINRAGCGIERGAFYFCAFFQKNTFLAEAPVCRADRLRLAPFG